MRIRYERRDPRNEDIREIEELRSIVEAQDRDLRKLTEQLRSMQMGGQASTIQLESKQKQQAQPANGPPPAPARKNKRPKISVDVIYEENEEQDASCE